jgi:hypothetical protein
VTRESFLVLHTTEAFWPAARRTLHGIISMIFLVRIGLQDVFVDFLDIVALEPLELMEAP